MYFSYNLFINYSDIKDTWCYKNTIIYIKQQKTILLSAYYVHNCKVHAICTMFMFFII